MPTVALKVDDPRPYTKDDMFREPDTIGRSLHDDACRFYRKVIGLSTPIDQQTQPSLIEITELINEKVEKDDLDMWVIIYSLNMTDKTSLWPADGEMNNSLGLLWGACRGYHGAALKHIHAVNLVDQSSKSSKRKAQSTFSELMDFLKSKN